MNMIMCEYGEVHRRAYSGNLSNYSTGAYSGEKGLMDDTGYIDSRPCLQAVIVNSIAKEILQCTVK